ncbi:Pentatricopeptide repeat [Macleaya cordata]|uniref:Pentatricopeptide repeat n=1 Tax=Macleaya cordata TaxID=56857 RepID=A0A200QBQ6_MACCD|nr:Pentatricopeptide repeat [Macleaya cordata]
MRERNVVSWTAMISAYSQRGYTFDALDVFINMLKSGEPPNEFTFASVLTSCAGVCGFDHGRQVHCLIIKTNFESHIYVGSSLLDMYAKSGRIHEARGVFERLPKRDVVSCTAIIAGYAQLGLDEEALELFRQLMREGMESNYVTYTSVLTALSGLAALDHGKQVHNRVLRSQLPSYIVLQNSLIDMYSKCGNLTYSRRVFDGMSERTVITWNAMLVGYSKHGLGREVVDLFQFMRKDKEVKPDNITFMAVLSGCSHGGLIDEGFSIFDEMINGKEGVKPEIEHYCCMVDLLGRAGKVHEAFDLIKKIPFEPTSAIWGSLLGACRVHNNVTVGEFVAHQLFKIEPQNAGNYVILSNLYASAGRWEDMTNVRELMKEKAVTKEPGRSWIKLDRILHSFHADDRSHPRKDEVVRKVRELSVKIKEAGYVPDLSCVLHDVDDEQKEKILLGHSEKLAIAFGLIGTSQALPIRVMKNLRICIDCHNFAKFVSKVYEIEISLRDSNRFHHIIGGICSCADYW